MTKFLRSPAQWTYSWGKWQGDVNSQVAEVKVKPKGGGTLDDSLYKH